jgi:hypothetical protein
MKVLTYLMLAAVAAAPVSAAPQGAKPAAAEKAATPGKATAGKAQQPITVYKTATCGCCGKWVEHLEAAGFTPTVNIVPSMDQAPPTKGVPPALRSCHTATLEGYTIEGHVPADVIRKLLKERPKIAGIAVPGMPAGSPGMESPNPVSYDIIAFDANGRTSVFASK